jgi:hypothetical protein
MKYLFYFFIISISFISITNIVFASQEGIDLIINEVMPNPIGDDSKLEWIELKNISDSVIYLDKWKLNEVVLPHLEVYSGEIVLLVRDINSIDSENKKVAVQFNLINSGATLSLSNTESLNEQKFTYLQSTEGKSFEMKQGDCSGIVIHPVSDTMGLENSSCDSQPTPTITTIPTVVYYTTYEYGDLKITAILPYPTNDSEWVEITNESNVEINLSGWVLKDESDKAYKIPENSLNSKEKIKIFPSSISLNNDGDVLNLFDPNSKLIHTLKYEKVLKDQVVSLYDSQITNNSENVHVEIQTSTMENDVKSITSDLGGKNIQDILKKPIFYKIEDYVIISD